MDAAKLAQLRVFVGNCKSDPSILHDPSLGFFRDYLESLGGRIPSNSASSKNQLYLNDPWISPGIYKSFTRPEQLTIFYDGSVVVYDDVPLDKVKAILVMAKKVSTVVQAINLSSGASLLHPFKGLVSNGQNLRQTLNNRNYVPHSCSGHSTAVPRGANGTKVMISPSHNVTSRISNSSMKIDNSAIYVPRARNASMVRFLEKRKDRLSTKTSFSGKKSSSKNPILLADVASSSKCSSTDISISSKKDGSWHEDHQIKSRDDNNDSPSTK